MADTERHEKELIEKSRRAIQNTKDPIEKFRLKCLSRGANGIKGISRLFRNLDDDGSKSLDFEEFKKGILEFGISVENSEIQEMFKIFDKDGSGTLSFDEFLEKLRPPMNESRKIIINKAFDKLDRTGDGLITCEDLQGVYNVRCHPKYNSGKWTEEQVLESFLKSFEPPNDADGKVTREEFFNYYSGLSASIDNDAYFDLMMRNSWKL